VGTLGYVLHRVFAGFGRWGRTSARVTYGFAVSGGDFGRHGPGGGGAARL
jgi:hypothetical protein